MNEQGQDEIEFTSQILYYPQKIQKKKKQKKKKKKHQLSFFILLFSRSQKGRMGGKNILQTCIDTIMEYIMFLYFAGSCKYIK